MTRLTHNILGLALATILVTSTSAQPCQDGRLPGKQPPSGAPFFLIYAVGSDIPAAQRPYPLPDWWSEIAADSAMPGLATYVSSVSCGAVSYGFIPIGTAGLSGGSCLQVDTIVNPSGNSGWWEFAHSAVMTAADALDFGPYADAQNNVYGALIIPTPCGNGRFLQDQVIDLAGHASGPVKFHCLLGLRETQRNSAVALFAHEFGHNWFGDFGYYDHYALGGYDAMGAGKCGIGFWDTSRYVDVLPSPYNPWSRLQRGWLTPVTVTASTAGLRIEEISHGKAYVLPTSDPTQCFLLTNHQRRSPYERHWPGTGLMIWHVKRNSDYSINRMPTVDLECAYGLHDWRLVADSSGAAIPESCSVLSPDPSGGRDSLDIDGIYRPMYHCLVGNAGDFFTGPTGNTEFSGHSNPSSNLYNVLDSLYPENLPSGIRISNIRKDSASDDMLADVEINGALLPAPQRPAFGWVRFPTAVRVTWAMPPGAGTPAKYVVVREQSTWSDTVYLVRVQSATSLVDTNLEPNRTYRYRIQACDSFGYLSSGSEPLELVNCLQPSSTQRLQWIGDRYVTSQAYYGTNAVFSFDPAGVLAAIDTVGPAGQTSLFADTAAGRLTILAVVNGRSVVVFWRDKPLAGGWSAPWSPPQEIYSLGSYGGSGWYYYIPSISGIDSCDGRSRAYVELYRALRGSGGWRVDYLMCELVHYAYSWAMTPFIYADWTQAPMSFQTASASASMTVDRQGRRCLLVATLDSLLFCRAGPTAPFNRAAVPRPAGARTATEPFLDSYGNTMRAVWVEVDSAGHRTIWTALLDAAGPVDKWLDLARVAGGTDTSCNSPQSAGRDLIAWNASDAAGRGRVMLLDVATGRVDTVSPPGRSAVFPRLHYRGEGDSSRTAVAWTRMDEPDAPQAIMVTASPGRVPEYYFRFGQYFGSPYTLRRSGYAAPAGGPSCDYDTTMLRYALTGFAAGQYRMAVVGCQDFADTAVQLVEVDGAALGTMTLCRARADTAWLDLPADNTSGRLSVTVRRLAGPAAAVSLIALLRVGDAAPESPAVTMRPLLLHSFPNPTGGTAAIRYQVPATADATVTLYDLLGRTVRVLASGPHAAGGHLARWDGRDAGGRRAVSGVYFYQLRVDGYAEHPVAKLMLVR